jgi:hypothetical protein
MFTGSFPVHDAPPINFFTSGLFGASPASAGPSWPEGPAADVPESLFAGLLGLGSLSELEKTIKLSSAPIVAGDGFLAPPPPPGFPPFACPFLTIVGRNAMQGVIIHVNKYEARWECRVEAGNKLCGVLLKSQRFLSTRLMPR